jgi:hypothetical protein
LKTLVLVRATVQSTVLADILSQCPQLENLQLWQTVLQGSSEPLAAPLSKLPSLSLTCDVEEEDLPTGIPRLAFLQHLGSCLTSLVVQTQDDQQLDTQVLACVAKHLHKLTSLWLRNHNGNFPEKDVIMELLNSPTAQQSLRDFSADITFPDMECVVKLLSLPKLNFVGGDTSFPDVHEDLPEQLDVPWPEGKPPVRMRLLRGSVRQLAALPLERFPSIHLQLLTLPSDEDRQQREQRLQKFLSDSAPKCSKFTIGGIESHPWDGPGTGRGVLGVGSPHSFQ